MNCYSQRFKPKGMSMIGNRYQKLTDTVMGRIPKD